MKAILALLLFTTLSFCARAQIQWQRVMGGANIDVANAIQQTTDSGYIVAGYTWSHDGDVTGNHGFGDCWVIKLSRSGAVEWQRFLGGSDTEQANAIVQTSDGGYLMVGYTNSNNGDVSGNHGGVDYWVVKLSSSGGIQWQKCYGGSLGDIATSGMQTSDGGYIVAGHTFSSDGDVTFNHGTDDYWIVKLSPTGAIQWQKSYGGFFDDQPTSIIQTTDGGYAVAGYTNSHDGDVTVNHGVNDYWIIKLSSSGGLQWQKSFGGSSFDDATTIQQTYDGGYIVGGHSYSINGDVTGNHGDADAWVVKLSDTGALEWQRSYGGNDYDDIVAILPTADSGYVLAGGTYSNNNGDVIGNHGAGDTWIVKLSSLGVIEWQQCQGGSNSDGENAMVKTFDGWYILAGSTLSNDGDVSGNHGSNDLWIVKMGIPSAVPMVAAPAVSVFPNPATSAVYTKGIKDADIKIYSLTGLLMCQANSSDHIAIGTLPSGMYFIRIFNDEGVEVYRDKIIKE